MNAVKAILVGLLGLASSAGVTLSGDNRPSGDSRHGSQGLLFPANQLETKMQQHPYVGIWVTADGHIRQELLPDGRYDEARGTRKSAYQGRYEIRGNHIDYWDDTGFTADGTFVGPDELHHGGMIFFREK